jgi:hypothetical protein
MKITFPNGKRCAFSVFDDTDVATLASIRPLYDYLSKLGIHTTKSVWSVPYDGASDYRGSDTLENSRYADYMVELKRRGFEIAFHGAGMESMQRADIEKGLATFQRVFGTYPVINAAHGRNRDNLYWGSERFSFWFTKQLYSLLSGDARDYFLGHKSGSAYFWGDLALKHLKYVRSFTFTGINVLNGSTPVVYHNSETPWVNAWFLSCDAENVEEFNALLASRRQESLERDGGMCVISTHFGKGFVENDQIHPETKRLLEELSNRNCWFAPVSELLDFYVSQLGCVNIKKRQLLLLELRWFVDSLGRRLKRRRYNPTEVSYLNQSHESPESDPNLRASG